MAGQAGYIELGQAEVSDPKGRLQKEVLQCLQSHTLPGDISR
jgi:hypothetical protein